jgi:hypothetical protein
VSQITTLLELRKRAEFLRGKMHGGSLMVCDAHTLLACLDSLATELETMGKSLSDSAKEADSAYHFGLSDAYRQVAFRLRGLWVSL